MKLELTLTLICLAYLAIALTIKRIRFQKILNKKRHKDRFKEICLAYCRGKLKGLNYGGLDAGTAKPWIKNVILEQVSQFVNKTGKDLEIEPDKLTDEIFEDLTQKYRLKPRKVKERVFPI